MTMVRPLLPALALLLLAAAPAPARTVRVPLDPATLGGAAVFTQAEELVARAAAAAGLPFAADPRPLPPQVILTLDTPAGDSEKSGVLLVWRGDMLPDQLAPGETGALLRKRPAPGGGWKTTRVREDFALAAHTNLVPAARFALPALILETPYQLGTLGDAPALLVLWRRAEEDSAPLAGFLALPGSPAALLDALRSLQPLFADQEAWTARFDALSR